MMMKRMVIMLKPMSWMGFLPTESMMKKEAQYPGISPAMAISYDGRRFGTKRAQGGGGEHDMRLLARTALGAYVNGEHAYQG